MAVLEANGVRTADARVADDNVLISSADVTLSSHRKRR
jgi:hypothetical protein